MSNTPCKFARNSFILISPAFTLSATFPITLLAQTRAPGSGTLRGNAPLASEHSNEMPSGANSEAGPAAPDTLYPVLFTRQAPYDSGGQMAWSIAAADLNGDGK